MKIPVIYEENKLAAVKAAGIAALIPLSIFLSLVGLFINPVVVGYAWAILILLVCGGFFVTFIGMLIIYLIGELYLFLYSKFSGTPRRHM